MCFPVSGLDSLHWVRPHEPILNESQCSATKPLLAQSALELLGSLWENLQNCKANLNSSSLILIWITTASLLPPHLPCELNAELLIPSK